MDIFVSVGSYLSAEQESFVAAIEARLRAIGHNPLTIGRNKYSALAPLHAVTELMDSCKGALVIAVERYAFQGGIERRGSPREQAIGTVSLATPWNQIEGAMARDRGLPLLVVVDEKLWCDGLLEKGSDWYVLDLKVDPAALTSEEFNGVLASWSDKVTKFDGVRTKAAPSEKLDPSSLSIGEILGALRPAQAWGAAAALAGAMAIAFTTGAKLAPLLDKPSVSPPAATSPGDKTAGRGP